MAYFIIINFNEDKILSNYDLLNNKFEWNGYFDEYKDSFENFSLNDKIIFKTFDSANIAKAIIEKELSKSIKEDELDIRILEVIKKVIYITKTPRYKLK